MLTLAEREEISRGLVVGRTVRSMAVALGRSPSTVRGTATGRKNGRSPPLFRVVQMITDKADLLFERAGQRRNLAPGVINFYPHDEKLCVKTRESIGHLWQGCRRSDDAELQSRVVELQRTAPSRARALASRNEVVG